MNQSDYPMCLRPTLTNGNPTGRCRRSFGGWVLVFTLVLSACNPAEKAPQFALTNITGASFGKELNLPDHNGKMRSLADFRGKVVGVFFGFTHCPDACPTTLSEMAQVMRELGPDAKQFQVLFVTVDPERDTREVLQKYVPSFHQIGRAHV